MQAQCIQDPSAACLIPFQNYQEISHYKLEVKTFSSVLIPLVIYSHTIPDPKKAPNIISRYVHVRGNTIKLHCFVIGKPAPEVHWYKDGILVKGENRTISTLENTLLDITIRNPNCTHIGNYSCKAKNEHGTIEHNVKSVTAEGVIHTFML